jgi:uncharacterized protein YjbI with pentapeptide repeats
VLDGLARSLDLRFILEEYMLETDEYGTSFPAEYYPPEHMGENRFWVLHGTDLRGFFFNDIEDLRETASLDKMRLDYAVFPLNTNLSGVNLEMTSLDETVFYRCKLVGTCLAGAGGVDTRFEECDMRNVLLWQTSLLRPDLRGSDLRGAYLEDCHLEKPDLDYRTRFDSQIARAWAERHIENLEAARIYRQLADAYRSHRFYGKADTYYLAERRAARELLRIECKEAQSKRGRLRARANIIFDCLSDLLFGYGVRPARIASWCLATVLLFALIVWMFNLGKPSTGLGSSLYSSVLTFTTFGLGEASAPQGVVGRAFTAIEAVLGVFLTSLFLITFARKVIRDQ